MPVLRIDQITSGMSIRKQAKDFIKMRKASLREAGFMWHERFLPRRFQGNARSLYNFRGRGRKYLDQKKRQFGHGRPLELSGDSKRMLMGRGDVSATGGTGKSVIKVTVKMRAPAYFRDPSIRTSAKGAPRHRKKKLRGQPDKVAELLAIDAQHRTKASTKEFQDIADKANRSYAHAVNTRPGREFKKIA